MSLAELPPKPETPLEAVLPVPQELEASITISMHGMAHAIREQVERDVEIWQELPILALQANGKNGRYEPDLTFLSSLGVYKLADDPVYPNHNAYRTPGLFGYFVACESGLIVRLKGVIHNAQDVDALAQDKEIFRIIGEKTAQDRLADFSAIAVRAGLRAIIDSPLPKRCSPSEEASRQAHVESEIARRGLTHKFTRNR